MLDKLQYLQYLKNSMGEEMAEMMSEEITKVMNEQQDLEHQYAQLITQRGQLKGISNKNKLQEVKKDIEVGAHFLLI
jgi:ribonucleotide reductase beta subunit family protein with ferritin-like domain